MDMEQVVDCMEYIGLEGAKKKVGNWIVTGAKQDLRQLEKDRVAKVIRG